jgi:hypothetical protein
MIRDYGEFGTLEQLDDSLLADTLDTDTRVSLGRIHPSFMGGEYLPNYDRSEVEIARIEFESTTCDVFSLRARPFGFYARDAKPLLATQTLERIVECNNFKTLAPSWNPAEYEPLLALSPVVCVDYEKAIKGK